MWVSVGIYMLKGHFCQLERQSEVCFWVSFFLVSSFAFYFQPDHFQKWMWQFRKNLWVLPGFIWEKMVQYKTINQPLVYVIIGQNSLECTNLKSTFEQTRSKLHACNKTWNEAKALSICFHCRHLAAHHYISVYRISIVVINVGSLQPAICSGDKMSYIIASKCCDLEMILPCIFLKACAKQSGKLTLQGTFLCIFCSVSFTHSQTCCSFKFPFRYI